MNKKNNINKTLLTISISALLMVNAHAVEPESIKLENGVVVTPQVDTGYKYDDNILSSSSDTVSSSIFTVDPTVNFLLDDGVNQYNIDLGLYSGTYLSSSDDNYLNTTLAASAHLEQSAQSRFDVSAEANWLSEARGTGISEGAGDLINEPLTYSEQRIKLGYEYGALSTPGKIALAARYYNKDYSNFEDVTQYRNYDSIKLASTFYYTTGEITDVFVEVSGDIRTYDKAVSADTNRDSNDYRALLGVQWEVTALTTGYFKMGYQEKDFDVSSRENFSGLSWDASAKWNPLTYSTVEILTSRAARDPDVQGDYIDESIYSIGWNHEWDTKLSTEIGISYTDEKYSGYVRTDKTTDLLMSVNYGFKRWLEGSLFIEYTDKDSTIDNIIFDKMVVGINFTVSM